MLNWRDTQVFAIELIKESKKHIENDSTNQRQNIIGERITILHLDHANELLMKSFLEKKDYVIDYLDSNKVSKGLKQQDKKDGMRSLSYGECLDLVAKELKKDETPLSEDRKRQIKEFHELRNNIQHRAIDLPLNKRERIGNFYPYLKGLYEAMFPLPDVPFPIIPEFESETRDESPTHSSHV